MSNFSKKPGVRNEAKVITVGGELVSLGGTLDLSRAVVTSGGDVDEVQDQLDSLSGSLNAALDEIEDFRPANIWYVDGINGDDATPHSGSFNFPYKTVGAALEAIGSMPLQTVFIMAMDESADTEELLITHEDLTIQGIANTYSYAFTWNAHLTLSGATRVKLKDIHIHGTISGNPCITDINSSTAHNLDNIYFTHDFSNQLGYITQDGQNGGGATFWHCNMFDVNIELGLAAGDNTYNFTECVNKAITTHSGNSMFYKDSRVAGPFYHLGGGCIIVNVLTGRTIDDVGGTPVIQSSASSAGGVLSIGDVNLVQSNGAFGTIDKTGDCPYALFLVNRDPSLDTLTGFRFFPIGSFDIAASHTAVNYNPSDIFIPEHLAAIDVRLGGSGDTASRPSSPATGQEYFDTDLGIPIWYNGAAWVNSGGSIV